MCCSWFFFKQKTAYEVRISDWSSYVCSSDLSEVDWDVELGSIVRMGQGTGRGPAFLFDNIKDYNGADAICRRVFTGGQGSYSRLAMMLGLPVDTPIREMVRTCRTIFNERIPPVKVATGPVKQDRKSTRELQSQM